MVYLNVLGDGLNCAEFSHDMSHGGLDTIDEINLIYLNHPTIVVPLR